MMQLCLVVWFVVARRHVRKLKREEKSFLKNLSSRGISRSNFKFGQNSLNSLHKDQFPIKV